MAVGFLKGKDIEAYQDAILKFRPNAHRMAQALIHVWRAPLIWDEVRSVADVALCEAMSRYDAARGSAFSTYFFYFLRGALAREVEAQIRSHGGINPIHEQRSDPDSGELLDSACSNAGRCPEQALARKQTLTVCREAVMQLSLLEQKVLAEVIIFDEKVARLARRLKFSRGHLSKVKTKALLRLSIHLHSQREELLAA